MNSRLVLLSILVYTIVLRSWQIEKIPPLADPSVLKLRYLSALLSIGSTFLMYALVKNMFKNTKLPLLASFVFAILPWTIEQGRIYSQVNNALFLLLVFLVLIRKIHKPGLKILFFVLCSLFFVLVYPDFWLFKTGGIVSPQVDYLTNSLILLSPSLLFYKNITFWWGGVREFGIMHLSLLPFFVVGIYQLVVAREYLVFIILAVILLISLSSPFLPESREFFLATPFISLIVAYGVSKLFFYPRFGLRVIVFLFLLLLLYDLAQFLHYYTIHYPQQVLGNLGKINEAF